MPSASKLKKASRHAIRAKLIFNAGSGRPEESPAQLAAILSAMQDEQILPEVFTIRPDTQIEKVVQDAIKTGIRLIVVAGGDGTIDSVVGAMVGKRAMLGIIPIGTRNNLALNLGIPMEIGNSVALLREGQKLKIDVGRVHTRHGRSWFLEATGLGLVSDLYTMADGLQHGDLAQIGGLFATFVSASPSKLCISLDGHKPLVTTAHMMLITNMPFLGPHLLISNNVSFIDGKLDVFTFEDMSKLNMISYAVIAVGGLVDDPGIKHYRAKHIQVVSKPQRQALADGTILGKGPISVHIHSRALTVMAGKDLKGATRKKRSPKLEQVING
jgi:diacylglycerol kinase (ATP)